MIGVMIFLTTVTILIQSYINIMQKEALIDSFEGLNVYQISDTLLEDDDFQSYLNEPNSLERVKSLYEYLEDDINEKFIYNFEQPIEMSTDIDDIEEEFLQGYEEGNPLPPAEDEDGDLYYSLKAVQLNEQAFEMFPVNLSEGTSFTAEDFHHANNPGVIPILLGADYADTYQIGDTLHVNYLFEEFHLEVQGFVESDSFVTSPQLPETYLDRYIIMPAQEFEDPSDNTEEEFQQRHYFQMINGAIYSSEERNVVEEEIESAKAAADFPHFELMGYSTTVLGDFFDAVEENIYWVLCLSIVLLIACSLSISTLMIKKIHDNYRNMMIHLISGGTMKSLFQYFLAEVFITVGIPGAFITFLFMTVLQDLPPLYVLVMAASVVGMILLAVIPIYIQFRRLTISMLLKREE